MIAGDDQRPFARRAHDGGVDAAERPRIRRSRRARRRALATSTRPDRRDRPRRSSSATCAQRVQLTIDDRARRRAAARPCSTPPKRRGLPPARIAAASAASRASCPDRERYQTSPRRRTRERRRWRRGSGVVAMSEPRIGRVLVASLHQAIAGSAAEPPRVLRELAERHRAARRDDRAGAAVGGPQLPAHRGDGLRVDHRARRRVRGRLDRQQRCRRSSGGSSARCRGAARPRGACASRAVLVRDTYPGIARDRPDAQRDAHDRSARLAVLRSARDVDAAAVRVLRVGDRPRAAALRPARRRPGRRVPAPAARARAACCRSSSPAARSMSPPPAVVHEHDRAQRCSTGATGPPRSMLRALAVAAASAGVAPRRAAARRRRASWSSRSRTCERRAAPVLAVAKRRRCCSPTNCRRAASAAITRDERVRAFEQLHLPLSASLSRATVIKVGELVGASRGDRRRRSRSTAS